MSDDVRTPLGELSSRTSAQVRWRVPPEWQDALLDRHNLRLPEWIAQGRIRVVKQGVNRTVYRVDLPQRTFFLKHYRALAALKTFANWLRGSPARREWRNARELSLRKVPTARPIALGESRRRGLVRDSYYLSEAVPGTCALDIYESEVLPTFPAAKQAAARRAICRALAQFCAVAHRSGVFHTDFHCGNVLLECATVDDALTTGALPRLHLIDLPKIRFSRPLSWPRTRDSLAMFLTGWLDRCSRSERWQFWKTYLAARPDLRIGDPIAAAREITHISRQRSQRLLWRRNRRSLENNRDFYQLRARGAVGHAVCDARHEELMGLLNNVERPFAAHDTAQPSRPGNDPLASIELTVMSEPRRVDYQRLRPRSSVQGLLAIFRGSRARQIWYRSHALLERRILTPRPLLMSEPLPRWRNWNSYLATEHIAGESVTDFASRLKPLPTLQRQSQIREALQQVGRTIGRMHTWKISHHNLTADHLILGPRQGQLEAWLVNVDSIRLGRHLSMSQRCAELARLADSVARLGVLSRSDRLRFLRAYVHEDWDSPGDWKSLWRQIARHALLRRSAL